MNRACCSKLLASSAIASVVLAGMLNGAPAQGVNLSGSALAQQLVRPGDALDPVLSALSAGRLVRDVVGPEPGEVALKAVPFGFGFTGNQLDALDVTTTPEGLRAIDSFVARLQSQRIDSATTEWTVYTLPPVEEAIHATKASGEDPLAEPLGSSLIVPRGTVVRFVGAVFQDGTLHAKTTVSAAADPTTQPSRTGTYSAMMNPPSGSQSFVQAGGVGCLERKQNSTAHYDPCQRFWKLLNDGSGEWDFYASEMHGTGKSHSVWTLSGLEVESRRTPGTPRQEWLDWDPGADAKTNCQSQSVSVSYAGASVGIDKQHCELWDIDKGAEPFDMSNWWKGDVWRSERQTAAMTLTKVRQDESVVGDFDFDYRAHP